MRLGLALLCLLPLAAAAQPDERLPDLTPREFEIQGELRISIPDLQRQPLRGFAPPPRTYVVPADRQAYVAPYGQRLEDLPADALPQPAPPAVVAVRPRVAQLDLAFGRYLGRLANLTLSTGGLGLDVGYSGYANFEPYDDREDFEARADAFTGRVGYRSTGPVRFGAAAEMAYDRYRLTGADLATLPDAQPDRTGRTVGFSASVEGQQRTPFRIEGRYASTEFEIDADDPLRESDDNLLNLTESRFEASGSVEPGPLVFDAAGAFSGLDGEGVGASLSAYSAGGAIRLVVGERGRLDLGGRLLGYSSDEANGGGSSLHVGPVARFELPLSGTARFFARTDPRVVRRSVADLFRENPYAVPEPILAPDVHLIDAEGGVEVQGAAFRLVAYGGGRYSPVHLYFEREPSGPDAGLYRAHYDNALVFRAGGDVTLYGPRGISVSAGAEGRAGALTDQDDRDLPYLAPYAGRLSLAVPFASGRGLVQVTGIAEGARPTDVEGEDADGWADLSAEAHYRLTRGIGLLVRGDHLAGRAERWPGFPRPPALVMAGLRAGW